MKLHGQVVRGPHVVTLYLPRGEDKVIVIKCGAVLDYTEFHKLCPPPTVPMKILRGGEKKPDFEHPMYKKQLTDYGQLKTHWMFLTSIKATEELTWESVDMSDTSTWGNYEKELIESGFSDIERQRILGAMMEANALNEAKLEEARESFLFGTRKELSDASDSLNGEAKIMPSGELPKESESAHRT